jgi:16S rRNA (guanine527-N7)-methyltransferase
MTTDFSPADPSLQLSRICRANALPLGDSQLEQIRLYVTLLLGWNSRVNLISRRDEDNVWSSHILHSLAILFFMQPPSGMRIVDIGTGGGLPGIPLAILRSDLRFVLVDSIRKKVVAVQEMVEHLGLSNVRVEAGRAEELGSQERLSGVFDIALARAVAPLDDLVRWSRRLLRQTHGEDIPHRLPLPVGRPLRTPLLVALKGGDLSVEIRHAQGKARNAVITSNALTFSGSDAPDLERKRLVTVEF